MKIDKLIFAAIFWAQENFLVHIILSTKSYQVQWLAEKLDFLEVYDIKWGYFEWRLHTLKELFSYVLDYVHKDMTWGFQMSYFSLP